MLKYKILSGVLATMLIASGGKILLLKSEKLNIGNKLVQTNRNVSKYVTNVDNTLNKNKIIIENLEKNNKSLEMKNKEINNLNSANESKNAKLEAENQMLNNKIIQLQASNNKLQNEENLEIMQNNNLTNENKSLNNKIKDLLDALAISDGNSNYQNMDKTKQMQIIKTLLHYWGYGSRTSSAIAWILGEASGFYVEPAPNNINETSKVVDKNKSFQKSNIIEKNNIVQNKVVQKKSLSQKDSMKNN